MIVREWFIAAGTVGATVVALYIGVLRERWRRPELSLEYHGPNGGDALVVGVVEGNPNELAKAAYARLRVIAAEHRSAAEDVEVMILSAKELRPRRGYPPNPDEIALVGQGVWASSLGWGCCAGVDSQHG